MVGFPRELATVLFTLPMLLALLLNDNKALPEGEAGCQWSCLQRLSTSMFANFSRKQHRPGAGL